MLKKYLKEKFFQDKLPAELEQDEQDVTQPDRNIIAGIIVYVFVTIFANIIVCVMFYKKGTDVTNDKTQTNA